VIHVQVTAVTSGLSDERFRGDAVGQALDVERAERLRLSRENQDLQVGPLESNLLLTTHQSNYLAPGCRGSCVLKQHS